MPIASFMTKTQNREKIKQSM